ncbi:hypothetical protein BJX64DRAFT_261849 [Aspergillus heterothallicus]
MSTTLTIPESWSAKDCPASTDLWVVYLTPGEAITYLGSPTPSSDCVPPGWTSSLPYYHYGGCPDGYTSACATGDVDKSTTICCPTARELECRTSHPSVWVSDTILSCVETVSSTTTALVTLSSDYSTYEGTTTTGKVTLMPASDVISAFGFAVFATVYDDDTTSSTSSLSSTITTGASSTFATAATGTSNNSSGSTVAADSGDNSDDTSNGSSSLSGGAIAGIAIGAVALIVLIVLVWFRAKVVSWIHRVTSPESAPQSVGTSDTPASPNYHIQSGPPAELSAREKGFPTPELSEETAVAPVELSAGGIAELPASETADLQKRS